MIKCTNAFRRRINVKGTFMENPNQYRRKENVGGSCDLNSDNKTDIADAMMLFQYSAGNLADLGSGKDIADLNGDGEIDVADAMILFQYVGGSRKQSAIMQRLMLR